MGSGGCSGIWIVSVVCLFDVPGAPEADGGNDSISSLLGSFDSVKSGYRKDYLVRARRHDVAFRTGAVNAGFGDGGSSQNIS